MKLPFKIRCLLVLSIALSLANSCPLAGSFITVSTPDPQAGSAGGGGDSWTPFLSPDGRYVLFSSTANNLVAPATNTVSVAGVFPPKVNVFLRDRTNGTTTLASVNFFGTGGGNGDSWPADLSTNGRYALFESVASDLVAGDTNGATDIFVRDILNGVTTLVSANTNGGFANGNCRGARMTPDGHYVAFVSTANNLVTGDTNGIADIFVRDLQAGSTTLVSVGAKNLPSGSTSESPEITPDGRYVAFYSTATNLVAGTSTNAEIYVRDLVAGITILASTNARAALNAVQHTSIAVSYNHAISADGKYVAYEASPAIGVGNISSGVILRYQMDSGLTDVVHTNAAVPAGRAEDIRSLDLTPDGRVIAFIANTNGAQGLTTCVAVWDAQTGIATLASGTLSNTVPANSTCDWPTLDVSGRWLSFISTATNLTTNTLSGDCHIYVRDLVSNVTVIADADTNGIGTGVTLETVPRFSADARYLAFGGLDSNLIPEDRNRGFDLVLRDLFTGGVEMISARASGLPSQTPNGASGWGTSSISGNGRVIAFSSDANNLTLNDTNQVRDVYVRDLFTGTNSLVSVATNGFSGDGISTDAAISSDGTFVAFASRADNLATGDNNNTFDVFVRDLQGGTTRLASINSGNNGSGNNDSFSPAISTGGRYVLFRSRANNLLPSGLIALSGTNLFVRDLLLNSTYAMTTSGVYTASMTPDGRRVAFVDGNGSPAGKLYVWDSSQQRRIYTNSAAGLSFISISPDGNHLAYWTGSSGVTNLFVADLAASTTTSVISAVSPNSRTGLRFSSDGRFLAFSANQNSTNQVYLYDFQNGTTLLVSQIPGSGTPAGGPSDSPDISADGRFVAFRSKANGLVPGISNTNGVSGIFLYDRLSETNQFLTRNPAGTAFASSFSFAPLFSGDGRTLVFTSWASDLASRDFNQTSDLLALTFLYATISPSISGPTISWPAMPGISYQVQFNTNVTDPGWQNLNSIINIMGNQASQQDVAPGSSQRFYRVLQY